MIVETAKQGLFRALLISLIALAVPVAGAFYVPERFADYEALLWLLALIPAFLLAYHKGWKGVATSLAFGMAILSVTYAFSQSSGRPVPDLLFGVVVFYLTLALMIGWLAERFRRDVREEKLGGAAFTDAATGLPNRKHADLHLEIEFNAAQRGRSLCVVLFDIDHFGAYNTRHGAIAGDEVLRQVASSLKRCTRRMNLSARYGEDEFVSILGAADDDGALVFVSRVQETLRALGGELNFPTLSVGVASFRPNMKEPADLMAAAHDALKRAKKDGAGRVRVHGRQGPVPMEPSRTEVAAAATPARRMPEGRGTGRKALVVVEEAPVRGLLARYLADHGFKVAQVSNVVDGVQCLSIEYDLLITDISLTEGIGAELVRAAKMRWPSIQVLGLAQLGDSRALLDTLNAGVDRFIEKPLDLPKLRQHLSELLARHDRLLASVTETRQLSLEFQAEKAEAAIALRRSEEEYRLVVESLQEVLFRLDAQGNFTFLNVAWTSMTEFSVSDSLGQPLLSFVYPPDRQQMEDALRALRHGMRNEVRCDLRMVARDASVRWAELRARPTYTADGIVNGATGTMDDITWQKHAEEQLRRTEAESRALLAALPDAVYGISRNGVLVSYEGPDLAAASQIGEELEHVFTPEIAQQYRDRLRHLFQTRDVQVLEYTLTRDGRVNQYEARFAIITDDEAVVIVRNTSDRQRLEEQLRQSQKLEAIGRLAGGLAHDFNNLLTVVQGNAHLLIEEYGDDSNARELAQQINAAAMRGADLIRQLLAFGRKQVLQPRVLNLNSVVSSVHKLLPTLLGEDIAISLVPDDALGLVKADPGQIEQVLVNIAAYAKARMPTGGSLRITTRNARPHQDYDPALLNVEPVEMVNLSIEDSGPAIDEETRALVFEPFFGDLTAAQSGLRLATVYGIVTQSGGAVTLDDAPLGGARFQIFLPRVDAAA